MRSYRLRAEVPSRAVPSQILIVEGKPSVSRVFIAAGILVASFGAAALGVVLAASSLAG